MRKNISAQIQFPVSSPFSSEGIEELQTCSFSLSTSSLCQLSRRSRGKTFPTSDSGGKILSIRHAPRRDGRADGWQRERFRGNANLPRERGKQSWASQTFFWWQIITQIAIPRLKFVTFLVRVNCNLRQRPDIGYIQTESNVCFR